MALLYQFSENLKARDRLVLSRDLLSLLLCRHLHHLPLSPTNAPGPPFYPIFASDRVGMILEGDR